MSAANILPQATASSTAQPASQAEPFGANASLLRFITCGSVDDGKSTLIGRLLYDTNSVFDDQLEALERDSRKFGTTGDTLDFALLVDGLTAEREQGITIDVAYRYFSTANRSFIIADTPGHEQYTRNMATGASQADLAIILVDARHGVLPQTRRHSFITSMVGIRSAIVAINKMDLVDFDQAAFDRISRDYETLLPQLNFLDVTFIPLSAKNGDNIISRSAATPWYNGPTLLEKLEQAQPETLAPKTDFRLPVQWINRPNLDFRGFCGEIAGGSVQPGDEVVALPSGQRAFVKAVYGPDGPLEIAGTGTPVTLTLTSEIDVSRGNVLVKPGDPIRPEQLFEAEILSLADRPLIAGSRLIARLGTAQSPAILRSLDSAINVNTFEARPTQVLSMNELGRVKIHLEQPVVATPYQESRDLGAFILIDPVTNETVALGVVTRVTAAAQPTAANANTVWLAKLRQHWLSNADIGVQNQPGALVQYRAIASALLAIVALILGAAIWAALLLGLADFLARPFLKQFLLPRLIKAQKPDPAVMGDGSGI
ncbi:sulfate adenylyltransferase subunit CysN [Aureimonas fodinaquatilis]|uniref:Bifunctional enzyme NodQ n=1 Tax=Aureimonas fodinaquatilis TaxID=2565783 RepID=A0A5B0DWS7_9HYPH|nr:sulfate adenylyltransferase subunit CysN [Aureimonas fodinaquatilis]KAA0969659.1 sulfate adenylyltransferase subunit CysN [Aureimonas fodinaquatilis]